MAKINYGKARANKKTVISKDIMYFCGIGDGIHDLDLYGYGPTQEAAALDFVKKFNKSNYTIATE